MAPTRRWCIWVYSRSDAKIISESYQSTYNTYPDGTEFMHVKAQGSGIISQVQIVWDRQMYIQPTKLVTDSSTYIITNLSVVMDKILHTYLIMVQPRQNIQKERRRTMWVKRRSLRFPIRERTTRN